VVARSREIERADGRALFVRGDVRSADDCARAVAEVERALGPIDILFNNAGVFFPRTVPETTEQEGRNDRRQPEGSLPDVEGGPAGNDCAAARHHP
jgi:NAD(P)-dependent dehydrogenase (short-subunit alcohol dehydrogenase family)